jgi:protein SCO1
MPPLNLNERERVCGTFNLTDHHGRSVSNESFRGRFMLVFFGFTHCRFVCPRALTKISGALDALGETLVPVCPLYITVDPERDTAEVMRKFLLSYPRIIGLTGSRTQIEEVKRNFRVFARRAANSLDDDNYNVPHTSITYLLDRDGQFVADFNDSIPLNEMVERLKSHLALRKFSAVCDGRSAEQD